MGLIGRLCVRDTPLMMEALEANDAAGFNQLTSILLNSSHDVWVDVSGDDSINRWQETRDGVVKCMVKCVQFRAAFTEIMCDKRVISVLLQLMGVDGPVAGNAALLVSELALAPKVRIFVICNKECVS